MSLDATAALRPVPDRVAGTGGAHPGNLGDDFRQGAGCGRERNPGRRRPRQDSMIASAPFPSDANTMDIVFLTDHLVRGGADAQLVRVATTLKRRGWQVGVLTMLPSVAFTEDLEAAGIPCRSCSRGMPWVPGMPVAMALRMTLQLLRWRPPVLITFNYHGDLMGRVCGRLAGISAIVSSFRTAHVKTPLREKLYRTTERLIDLTAANSHAGIRYLVSRRILTPTKTLVIPNGIITAEYPSPATREEVRSEFGFQPETFVWLAVGNILPSKDYPTLLAAAARCATGWDFRLLVAGGGPPEILEALRAEVERSGLKARVQVLGARTDVPRLLRACDAYVLSSAWEGMPNTVMEAMASGVPVVSTDAGGVRELVQDGCGFIVPCRDPEALAGGMGVVMAMAPGERERLGAAGREVIALRFENERVVDRWEAMIRQLIRATARNPRRPGAVTAGPAEAARTAAAPPPAFVISLDFELMWGVRDKRSITDYGDHVLGEREAIPAMLELFRRYQVRATWAVVGLTLFDRKEDLLAHLPERRPGYANRELDPYLALADVGANEATDPYHYGLSLVRQIQDCEGMEVASHTFGHYYCLEDGQDAGQFRADLEAWIAAAARLSVRPDSFVFPRNQSNYEYLSVCAALGFKVFRGNEDSWMYQEARKQDHSPLMRAARLMDNYVNLSGHHGFVPRPWLDTGLVNCPSSRFLRPYFPRLALLEGHRVRRIQRAMTLAASRGESFHLWWHPHNFGTNLGQNLAILEQLLRHHAGLRERYGVVPMTMAEVGGAVRAAENVSG